MKEQTEILLSIIIPVYNTERFLTKCLDSIFVQEDDCFEVILVNDGSKGNCREIAARYSEMYNNLIYIEKKNGGLSSARNTGIANARGKYCSFVDSDDYVSESYISTLKSKILRQDNIDILIFGLSKLDGNEEKETVVPHKERLLNNENALIALFSQKEYRFHAVTKVIKTELLKKKELLFPLNTYYEDVATIYKWFLASSKIHLIPEVLYLYTTSNEGSITQENFSNKQFELWINSIEIYNFIHDNVEISKSYVKFLQRTYVDICRVMKNAAKEVRNDSLSKMKKDLKTIPSFSYFSIQNMKNKYGISFVLSYLFPQLFFVLLKLKKG